MHLTNFHFYNNKNYLYSKPVKSLRGCGVGYGFSFNGKELDIERMGGGGSTYDYGFRIYNAQLGKFLSVDPLTRSYPWYTPYQFAGNTPIASIDLEGLEEIHYTNALKNDGFNQALKLLEKSGVKEEIEKSFALSNTKYDIHFVIQKTGVSQDNQTCELIGQRGRTFNKYKEKGYSKSIDSKNLYLSDLRKENPNANLNEVANTINKGKNVIIISISEEMLNLIKTNPDLVQQAAMTIAHEIELHAIDIKNNKKNENEDSSHQRYFKDKTLNSGLSPSYRKIKKDSDAGKTKDKIEKAKKNENTKNTKNVNP